ncbi:MAG: AAA family ATPase [Steroidobacteraceae bacterium]
MSVEQQKVEMLMAHAETVEKRDINGRTLNAVRLSDVEAKPLRPLWPGRLWHGKLSLLAGDPGLGKSLGTLDVTARITTGREWPASVEKAPLGNVVLLSAEDDAADTLRPRLEAAGADLTRVHIIIDVGELDSEGRTVRRTFNLSKHLPELEKLFQKHKPALLVIDPISAYLDTDSDSHNNSDVRAELAPLAELAQRYGVAVLMVSHLNKATTMAAIYRVTGSVAFVAAARSAFGVIKDPDDKGRRLLLPLKVNLGKDTGGLAYRIKGESGQPPMIEWKSKPVEVDIDEVTSGARTQAKKQAVGEVADWLRDLLSSGAVAATDLWRKAKEAGYSERRVKSALNAIGGRTGPIGYGRGWQWWLPADANAPKSNRPNLSDSGRLSPGTDTAESNF